jgi:hypothetical protein
MAILSAELVDFVEGGVSILVGTRDEALKPEAMRALGAQVGAGRDTIVLFLPEATSVRTRANAEKTGVLAVTFSRILDHKTIQVKGRVNFIRPTTAEERALQERYHVAFSEQLSLAGVARSVSRRARKFPSWAVEVSVDELFAQTPGPGAGKRMSP